jgi:hypothetical protein
MTYGSETWPLKVEHESKLETTDMRMIRWICGMSLRDRISSTELRTRIVVEQLWKYAGEIGWDGLDM